MCDTSQALLPAAFSLGSPGKGTDEDQNGVGAAVMCSELLTSPLAAVVAAVGRADQQPSRGHVYSRGFMSWALVLWFLLRKLSFDNSDFNFTCTHGMGKIF